MEIEIDQIVLPAQTDRHGQTLVWGMALPTTQDLEIIERFCLVHFKEGHRVRNRTLKLLDMLERRKATRDGFLVIAFREVTINLLNTTIIPKFSFKSKFVTRWRKLKRAYEALRKARHHWHEEQEDVLPFVKYLLGTILAAYKTFEERFTIIEEKLPALELVRKATQQKLGRFTKQDILKLCPSLSISSIGGALRKLVARGEIQREGIGRATKYKRLK